MTATRSTAKLTRWIDKREGFTRREAWQAVKGGSIRTVEQLDEELATLVFDGVIEPAPVQPSRGVAYVVTARRVGGGEARNTSQVSLPSTGTHSLPSPGRSADDVLASAAAKKRTEPNAPCLGRLREIELRCGKIAGDNLRASDLHPTEIDDLEWLGA